jgi:hypothetical protein
MLIRWSDQEDPTNWTPESTNQAGSIRLSRGTEIVAARQARQEVLVWTNSSLYSLQYQGAPGVWGAQIVGDNISIVSQNSVGYANGVAYWMGQDKFYMYDGRVQTLPCNVRRYVFDDFNHLQLDQCFAGTVEAYHEIWWFYCSEDSQEIDRYVVFNYVDNVWYYGTMARTAWLDSGLRDYPLAATYSYSLVNQELGCCDNEDGTVQPITSYVQSGEFDLDDGDRFALVRRIMPDITFEGSERADPSVDMTLYPLKNSGSGYNSPKSESGEFGGTVVRSATIPVEQYTQQIDVRVRGRQMALRIESVSGNTKWQLGSPRIDMRPDGRR